MTSLAARRCLRHRQREAVAMCPECGHYYCRECISEHEGRILCTRCLNVSALSEVKARGLAGRTVDLLSGSLGLLFLWMVFYYFGKFLLALPSSFHEGTLWSAF